MKKHLPKKYSLHLSWIISAMAFILGGFIINSYLGVVRQTAEQSAGTVLGAAVGTSASVPANPINTLAQQLSQKEDSLDQREAELALRELTISNQIQAERNRMLVYLLIGAMVIMGLVAYNFYLDYKYRHEQGDKSRRKMGPARQGA